MSIKKLLTMLLLISLSLLSKKIDGLIRGIAEKSVSTIALFSLALHEFAQVNRNSVVQFTDNTTSLATWDYVSMYTPGFNDSSMFKTSSAGRVNHYAL